MNVWRVDIRVIDLSRRRDIVLVSEQLTEWRKSGISFVFPNNFSTSWVYFARIQSHRESKEEIMVANYGHPIVLTIPFPFSSHFFARWRYVEDEKEQKLARNVPRTKIIPPFHLGPIERLDYPVDHLFIPFQFALQF